MDGWQSAWFIAIAMALVASWVLYRYAAPKRLRDWQGAGLVQAFIIALYAEMYGFPLTLYVLTGVFGVDIPFQNSSGHLWATLLGYGPVGGVIEMVLGLSVVIAGVVLLARGWREVHRGSHEDRLVTTGPYAVVRHPQYLGIFIALLGELIHWPTILTLALLPFVVLAYVGLARKEERELLLRFGDAYRDYQRRVPTFIPRLRGWRRLTSARSELAADSARWTRAQF